MRNLYLTNTLTKTKELFKPVHEGHVGMYVCGPTVYGDAHLGHARPGVTYDVLFKLLRHLGYKVRYVRNITDVTMPMRERIRSARRPDWSSWSLWRWCRITLSVTTRRCAS